jgi:hypothetical protein
MVFSFRAKTEFSISTQCLQETVCQRQSSVKLNSVDLSGLGYHHLAIASVAEFEDPGSRLRIEAASRGVQLRECCEELHLSHHQQER